MTRNKLFLVIYVSIKIIKYVFTNSIFTSLEGYKDFMTYYSSQKRFTVKYRDKEFEKILLSQITFKNKNTKKIMFLFNQNVLKFIKNRYICILIIKYIR